MNLRRTPQTPGCQCSGTESGGPQMLARPCLLSVYPRVAHTISTRTGTPTSEEAGVHATYFVGCQIADMPNCRMPAPPAAEGGMKRQRKSGWT